MKRTKQTGPTRSSTSTGARVIGANRLTDICSGSGITIQIVGPTPFDVPLQHNETFVRL